MLPIDLAKKLGLSHNPAKKTKLYGIGEQAVYASPGETVFQIGDQEIVARSYFVYSRDSVLLLGRLDIFDRFSIIFDQKREAVVFKKEWRSILPIKIYATAGKISGIQMGQLFGPREGGRSSI